MWWLDRAYLALAPRTGCFTGGWGRPELLAQAVDGGWREMPVSAAELRWTRARTHGSLRIVDGALTSPEDEQLPIESRVARVRLLEPRRGEPRGLAVVLAAWGDEGFEARQRVYRRALDHGIALMLLENAFYGTRRPVGQRGSRLRVVSDFVVMGRATVREGRALLRWAREAGYPRVGVVGFSMGGQMAAMTGALCPEPVRIVTIAASTSPATVFLDGPLRRDVAWAHLGAGAPARMREVMEALSILSLPPPADPSLARVVGTRHDEIVRPGDAGAIARHWGVHPRWLDDGHVSAVALRPHALAQALIDAFA